MRQSPFGTAAGGPAGKRRWWACAIFLVFLALYGATLLPDVLPADAGELQWVAATADVAHPPGYPLYTMLGWLFSKAPLGPTSAWRVNLLSAVTAAATVALAFSTVWELSDSVLGGLAAAVTLGSATTFWATATKASIRPLTAFFTALCIYALVRHASEKRISGVGPEVRPEPVESGMETRPTASDTEPQSTGARYLVLFSLAFGLGVTHHPSLAFPGVVFVVYLVLVDPALLRQPSRWLKAVAALLPGLLVLVYLPVRGAPDLATPSGFLDHVLARGFRGDMFALGLIDRSVLLPTLLRFQFNGVLLLGMGLGALTLLWHDRKLALLLVGSFLVPMMVTLTYDAPQTVEYAMPAYVPLALLMGVFVGYMAELRTWTSGYGWFLADRGSARSNKRAGSSETGDSNKRGESGKREESREKSVLPVICRVGGIALLLAAFVNLFVHLPSYRSLSRSHGARKYVQAVLGDAPEDAVILSNWHWFTPLRYVQQIEGARPDVDVEYVAPGGEPLAQTWVRRIEERISERPVIVVRAFEREYSALPYTFEPLGEAFLVRPEPRGKMPPDMVALDEILGGQIEVLGYRLASEEARPAQPLTVSLAWSPVDVPATEIALFAQLIGPDGELWSTAEDPRHPPHRLPAEGVVVDRFMVYPRLHAPPGEYTLVVGAYPVGDPSQGRLTTADGSDVMALETVRLEPSTRRPVTQHPCFARLAGGSTLIGVDYDVGPLGQVRIYLHWKGPGQLTHLHLMGDDDALLTRSRVPALERGQYATVAVDRPGIPSRLVARGDEGSHRWNLLFNRPIRLPPPNPGERYVPFGNVAILTHASGPDGDLEQGTETTLSLRFRGQRPLARDYIISTSLTGLNSDGTWAWRASHDTVPALGAIPTLKWIHGSLVLDPHRMEIPDDAQSVPASGSLVIYDHFTQRSLPSLDERHAPAVELGTWHVAQ